ncbi:helix-turn-helix transcriptional regulator [Roseobacteraceae bacterium S113]
MRSETNSDQTSANQNSDLDAFINEKAAADFLCHSVRTLQKWRVSGNGPDFFKQGRSVRYRRRELIAWAEARRRQHTSQ